MVEFGCGAWLATLCSSCAPRRRVALRVRRRHGCRHCQGRRPQVPPERATAGTRFMLRFDREERRYAS